MLFMFHTLFFYSIYVPRVAQFGYVPKQLSNFKWFEKYLKLIRIASDKDQMVQHSTQLNKKTDLSWGRNWDVGVLFLNIHSPGMTYVDHVFSFAENCTCRMYCSRNTYPKY